MHGKRIILMTHAEETQLPPPKEKNLQASFACENFFLYMFVAPLYSGHVCRRICGVNLGKILRKELLQVS